MSSKKQSKLADDSPIPDEELRELEVQLSKKLPQYKNLPSQERREILSLVMRSHSGPLPDAETLSSYNDTIPNGAERIMIMAEESQQASIAALNKQLSISEIDVKGHYGSIKRAQVFAFSIAILCIGLGSWLVTLGFSTFAYLLVAAPMLTLAGAFIKGVFTKSKDGE